MKATGWGLCAMALLTAGLAGCPGADIFTQKPQQPAPVVEEQFVDGKIEVVSDRVQGALRQLGIQAVATPEAEGVRLNCTTAAGKHFAVVMTRSSDDAGMFTNVREEWEEEADSGLTRQLLAGLQVLVKN